jgi:hypothetical protein
LNVWHHPDQQMRRWCACTALGRYSQREIDRYQVWMLTNCIRSKRQFCCASWHLHKKIKKVISPCHHNLVVRVWRVMKLLWEGICFNSFLMIKMARRWKMSSDLLASRSNPAAQEHVRITHRINFKMFIIFWIFFTLAVCQSLYKTKNRNVGYGISANYIHVAYGGFA